MQGWTNSFQSTNPGKFICVKCGLIGMIKNTIQLKSNIITLLNQLEIASMAYYYFFLKLMFNNNNEFSNDSDYISSRVFDLEITIIKLSKRLDEIEPCKKICCEDLSKRNKLK